MHKKHFFLLSVASVMFFTSCSKLGPLSADNFTVTPNPLETQAGTVPATINGHFPEKYMKKKAVVTVVPELRYSNGKIVQGNTATFQGESVLGNDQTISYRLGGNYTMKTNFAYADDNKADMYLTFNARIGKKVVQVPEVKVAYGIIATSELYKKTLNTAQAAIAPDAYQRITKQKQEANIKFLIQQATLRKSELKNNSVQEFVKMLQKINADREGLNLDNVEVSAYASPDGGFSINDKLAAERQKVSEKYVSDELKKIKLDANVDAKYTAQDWDGFQELVKASDIQDKDVILRVLSMYKDPEEREQQIKNISSAFRELADGILPQLRRARLTINYETVGRSDEQILQQINNDATELSVEELLYGAALKEDLNDKEKIYDLTTKIYQNDPRAYNNLATIQYARGNYDAARQYIQKAQSLSSDLPEAQANLGMLALKAGDLKTAEQYIAAATGANGLGEVLGNLHLAQGNYAQAEQDFADIYSNSAALAQILNKNYASAAVTLKYVKNADAVTEYLKSILSARMGNLDDAAESLRKALAKDPSMASYAANDLELTKVKK
ncbi:MAG: tetratricopeptide repeat protein [Prevotella sp.]|nr:tetratricopeptide repeat protein [Prevotella sp.]MBR1768290.1 tetratricopeptide repeat protein [Prevotella sp.]